ncbi:MAG: hypothetical protein AAF821_08235 [Cyanobacteria bacterium P01_D01_bin.156]
MSPFGKMLIDISSIDNARQEAITKFGIDSFSRLVFLLNGKTDDFIRRDQTTIENVLTSIDASSIDLEGLRKEAKQYALAQFIYQVAGGENLDADLLVQAAERLINDGFDTPERLAQANQSIITDKLRRNGNDIVPNPERFVGEARKSISNSVAFVDMRERNEQLRQALESERTKLLSKKNKNNGSLPNSHERELRSINRKLYGIEEVSKDTPIRPSSWVVDPLFEAVRKAFAQTNQKLEDHFFGKLRSQENFQSITSDEKELAAVYGILQRNHITDPKLGIRFTDGLSFARSEYNNHKDLFDGVYDILAEESNSQSQNKFASKSVNTQQWATVVKTLANQGIAAKDRYLSLHTKTALSRYIAADEDAPGSTFEINLPDLEQESSVEIIKDNILAMQAIYFAAILEDLKLFQVVDRLVELFQIGMLPLGKSHAGDLLFERMENNIKQFSEYDRRNLYARTLGFPGGEASGLVNRDFQMLWMRFISAISSFARQTNVDTLLRSSIPYRVSQEQIRKSGRDLAANLSLHGFSIAHYAAVKLERQIKDDIKILSDPEVKGAYGAKDMYGVIDQVAATDLGGPRNSIQYRTMASSGAVIIRWLANHATDLSSVNSPTLLDINEIAMPYGHASGSTAMISPHDSDLVNACERWLAVTGTPDNKIETYANPYEGPTLTSRPVQIPSIAQDMLESVGVGNI